MSKPRTVGIRLDYETKSATNIDRGAYKYTEDKDFDLLICAYSPIRQYPGGARTLGKPRLLDLKDIFAVNRFQKLLLNPHFEKHAFNANFERIVSSKWMGMPNGTYIDPQGWYCTAVLANTAGVFGTLDEVSRALRTKINKDAEGKALIKFFSVPIPARAKRSCDCDVFHEPAAHPAKFARYEDYCKQDVVTEAAVALVLPTIPPEQQTEYEMDQRINDRGFRHFKSLSVAAVKGVEIEKTRVMGKLKRMTGVDNPNSPKQFSGWLETQGYPMVSLDKDHREEALADPFVPDEVRKALILKGMASLTSVTKHKAALSTRCEDGRIRGSLRFYGAHTGREAGRGIQPQNLPKYEAPLSDFKRLLNGTAGKDAPTIAKGTVRGSIVPARDHVFVVVDYNAIEARILGWEAQEQWVMDEFTKGPGKIYEATAATMFGVDKDKLLKSLAKITGCDKCGACPNCRLRGAGKVSELALGYAGGAGALVTMGAEKEGIDVGNYNELHAEWTALGKPGKFWQWEADRHDYPELLRLRDLYRESRPRTRSFWKQCGTAWDIATSGKVAHFGPEGRIAMMRDGKHNRLVLPSGRSIWYRYAASHRDQNNPDRVDRRTFIGKSVGVGHHRTDTHGGKLTENITQAIARDVLFWVMLQIEAANMPGRLVLHVHDEVVLEVPERHADQVLADTKGLMAQTPAWAPGLVLKGEGDIMERYKK